MLMSKVWNEELRKMKEMDINNLSAEVIKYLGDSKKKIIIKFDGDNDAIVISVE